MDFQLTETQRLIRDSVREYAERELAPMAGDLDRLKQFPTRPLQRLVELGILSMAVPPEYGGAGADGVSSCLALMEISRACASTAVAVSVHNALACEIVYRYGTEAQRQKYLPGLCGGEILGAFSLTETTSGSDAASLRTTAHLRRNHYLLNGTKIFVTNGSRASAIILFASTDLSLGDKDRWSRAMDDLRTAALGNHPWGRDLLMPRILEAVRAYATVGEIIGLLREVWGEYTELPVI